MPWMALRNAYTQGGDIHQGIQPSRVGLT